MLELDVQRLGKLGIGEVSAGLGLGLHTIYGMRHANPRITDFYTLKTESASNHHLRWPLSLNVCILASFSPM